MTEMSGEAAGRFGAQLMTAFPKDAAGVKGLDNMLQMIHAMHEASGANPETLIRSLLAMQGFAARLGIKPEDTAGMAAFMQSLGLPVGTGGRGGAAQVMASLIKETEGKVPKKQAGAYRDALEAVFGQGTTPQSLGDRFQKDFLGTLEYMGQAIATYKGEGREKLIRDLFPNAADYKFMLPMLQNAEQMEAFIESYRAAAKEGMWDEWAQKNATAASKMQEGWSGVQNLQRHLAGEGGGGITGFAADMLKGAGDLANAADKMLDSMPKLSEVAKGLGTFFGVLTGVGVGGAVTGKVLGFAGLTTLAGKIGAIAAFAPEIALIAGAVYTIWRLWPEDDKGTKQPIKMDVQIDTGKFKVAADAINALVNAWNALKAAVGQGDRGKGIPNWLDDFRQKFGIETPTLGPPKTAKELISGYGPPTPLSTLPPSETAKTAAPSSVSVVPPAPVQHEITFEAKAQTVQNPYVNLSVKVDGIGPAIMNYITQAVKSAVGAAQAPAANVESRASGNGTGGMAVDGIH
jgi:hypothetical protein